MNHLLLVDTFSKGFILVNSNTITDLSAVYIELIKSATDAFTVKISLVRFINDRLRHPL